MLRTGVIRTKAGLADTRFFGSFLSSTSLYSTYVRGRSRPPIGQTLCRSAATQNPPPPRAKSGRAAASDLMEKRSAETLIPTRAVLDSKTRITRYWRQGLVVKPESNAKSCVPPVNFGDDSTTDAASIGDAGAIRKQLLSSPCHLWAGTVEQLGKPPKGGRFAASSSSGGNGSRPTMEVRRDRRHGLLRHQRAAILAAAPMPCPAFAGVLRAT